MLKNLQKYSMKKAIIQQKKFKQYINKYEEILEVLQQFMEKHVINFIDRYLLYLKDSKIEKTSNKLDNYYRNTDPEIIKKYKTRNGILSQLYYQMLIGLIKKKKIS